MVRYYTSRFLYCKADSGSIKTCLKKSLFFFKQFGETTFFFADRETFTDDLLYTTIAHEGLPVSLVDSVTAKVGFSRIR